MNFRVGQKVVCVDDASQSRLGTRRHIRTGEVYVIRWVGPYEDSFNPEFIGIRLAGIERSLEDGRQVDVPYNVKRFRPVVEKKTDISIFTEMLKPREFALTADHRT